MGREWDKSAKAFTLPEIRVVPDIYSSRSGKTWYAGMPWEYHHIVSDGKTPEEAVEALQKKFDTLNAERRGNNASQMTTKFY